MISASKTTFSHFNLKILRPKVMKNIKNLRKKFCEFRPRTFVCLSQQNFYLLLCHCLQFVIRKAFRFVIFIAIVSSEWHYFICRHTVANTCHILKSITAFPFFLWSIFWRTYLNLSLASTISKLHWWKLQYAGP